MKRHPQILLTAALICLSTSSVIRADPVTITGGFLLSTGVFEVSPPSMLTGTGGFSLTTNVAIGANGGDLFPLSRCQAPCLPGETLSLQGLLGVPPADLGLKNTVVRHNGVEYRDFSGGDDLSGLRLMLEGSTVLPGFGDFGPVTLTAPFTLTGFFVDVFAERHELSGQGTASLWLRPTDFENTGLLVWSVDQVRYEFVDSAAPVPEPATLLLLGTGLGAVLVRRRSRR